MFRLQVAVICCSYYFTSLETLDFAFRTLCMKYINLVRFGLQFNTAYAEHRKLIVLITNWVAWRFDCANDLEQDKMYNQFKHEAEAAGVEFCFHVELQKHQLEFERTRNYYVKLCYSNLLCFHTFIEFYTSVSLREREIAVLNYGHVFF